MTIFDITTGSIILNEVPIGIGYAGQPPSVNDAGATQLHAQGPLPVGQYTIGPAEDHPESVGAFALPLTPDPSNNMYGRSSFYIHGDNPAQNQTASDGCIVTSHATRVAIDADPERILQVVA